MIPNYYLADVFLQLKPQVINSRKVYISLVDGVEERAISNTTVLLKNLIS